MIEKPGLGKGMPAAGCQKPASFSRAMFHPVSGIWKPATGLYTAT
jgi:hypothetical protein